MREEWLAAIAAHVTRVEQGNGDALDPAPLEAARRLAETLGDDPADLAAWHLLGRFHMHRDSAIFHAGQSGWQADNEAMLGAFARCLLGGRHVPQRLDVPADILVAVAKHAGRTILGFPVQDSETQHPDGEAIAQAPLMWQRLVAALPADSPARPTMLASMSGALLDRFVIAGDPADVDAAVTVGLEAVTTAAADDPMLPAIHAYLGHALGARFDQRCDPTDIDGAIAALERALELSQAYNPARTTYLSLYSNCLRVRYDHFGDRADLDGVIAASRLAAETAGDEARPSLLRNTAHALLRRFEETASIADLDDAITSFRQALELPAAAGPIRSGCLSGLGTALRSRFGLTRDVDDLDEAVSVGWQSVAEAHPTDPDRPVCLSNLGTALSLRATFRADPADAESALAVSREAVMSVGSRHRLRPMFLSNLAAVLRARATTLADLTEAITLIREAVDLTPPGNPDRGRFLMNLCDALLDRLGRTDDPAAADEAVEVGRQMLETYPQGHVNRANALLVLGNALRRRAGLLGQAADLDEAVAVTEQAIAVLPPGPARTEADSELGVALRQRFRLTHRFEDLDRAVALFRESADESGADTSEYAWAQNDLGRTLLLRYEHVADAEDLTRAVAALREALAAPAADLEDQTQYRSELSEALQLLFGQTGRTAQIDEAVELSRQAVEWTPAGHPNLSGYRLVLGKALAAQAKLQDSEAAAIRDMPDQPPRAELAARLAALVDIEKTAELPFVLAPGALDTAQRLADHVSADATPDIDSHALLGRYFWLRYLALPADPPDNVPVGGDDADISADSGRFALFAAIDFYTLPFTSGRRVPPGLARYIAEDIGDGALADLFERVVTSGDAAAITEAVELWRRILATVPDDHPARGVYTGALGTALQTRYFLAGDRTDLDEGLMALRAAVAAVPDGDPFQPVFRGMLSDALRADSEVAENGDERESALDQAVVAARQAVDELIDPTAAERGFWQAQLGMAVLTRYQAMGNPSDLDAAVSLLSEAAAAVQEESQAAVVIAVLSEALYSKFAATGDLVLLDEAINVARRTVTVLPDSHPSLIMVLNTLGRALRDRAELHDSEADLNAAIDALTRAFEIAVQGSPILAAVLANLGAALLGRFSRTGQAADLDAAIDFATQASALASDGSAVKAALANLLSRTLLTRFELTGAERDLDAALAAGRQACAMLPPAHPEQAGFRSLYAAALQEKYARTEQLRDLDEAIGASRQALAVLPSGHINTALYQAILAGALRLRFAETENDADLDEAIELTRTAQATPPPDYAFRPLLMGELGISIFFRFMYSQQRADFDEAADWLRKAVASAEGRSSQPELLLRLATVLDSGFQQYGSPQHRDEALSLYSRAAQSAASPRRRIAAARLGAAFARQFAPDAAAALLETAVRLLPVAASRQLDRAGQQQALREFAFLSNEAAELTLIASGPDAPARALGQLELSRAVLQGQALDNRRDLLDLYAAHPALAQRFHELTALLDAPDDANADVPGTSLGGASALLGVPMTITRAATTASTAADGMRAAGAAPMRPSSAGQASNGSDRYRVGAEFASLLDQIRSRPGFESFLLPPEPTELTRQAAQGPIVAFNVGQSRCDALIVTPGGIEHVPLPDLSGQELASRIDLWEEALDLINFRDAGTGGPRAAETTLNQILEWLWDVAADPLLTSLDYTGTPAPGQPWPRIWWAPGGFLGMLPVHAAGYHRAAGGATVLDRVVSSYIPTVRALAYARQRSRSTPPSRALIVAMPTTPGLDPLSNVAAETAALSRLLPSPTVLIEPEGPIDEHTPTRERVLAALDDAGIAHFTCHAASHPDNPSYSQIYLHDHEDSPLTVATLIPARLPHAQLAFLSACQTARSEDLDLLDEAIHLTTAFQQAGFPHVIGTLWTVLDTVAVDVAVNFYERLRAEQGTLIVANSAHALHHAVRSVRDLPSNPTRPSRWAAFIHVGA